MKIETVPIEQAKSIARASRIPEEVQQQILEMIQTITKDEGVKITLEPDERAPSVKKRILEIANSEGITVEVRATKKGKQLLVWRK